jgi:hypothetical protein
MRYREIIRKDGADKWYSEINYLHLSVTSLSPNIYPVMKKLSVVIMFFFELYLHFRADTILWCRHHKWWRTGAVC